MIEGEASETVRTDWIQQLGSMEPTLNSKYVFIKKYPIKLLAFYYEQAQIAKRVVILLHDIGEIHSMSGPPAGRGHAFESREAYISLGPFARLPAVL